MCSGFVLSLSILKQQIPKKPMRLILAVMSKEIRGSRRKNDNLIRKEQSKIRAQ